MAVVGNSYLYHMRKVCEYVHIRVYCLLTLRHLRISWKIYSRVPPKYVGLFSDSLNLREISAPTAYG